MAQTVDRIYIRFQIAGEIASATAPGSDTMIKIFNHYLHRQTLLRMLSDLGFILVAMVLVFATQLGSLDSLLPMAGTQVAVAGRRPVRDQQRLRPVPEEPQLHRQPGDRAGRLRLLLALPLAWFVLGLLPASLEGA
jgi:hypothetical protein